MKIATLVEMIEISYRNPSIIIKLSGETLKQGCRFGSREKEGSQCRRPER